MTRLLARGIGWSAVLALSAVLFVIASLVFMDFTDARYRRIDTVPRVLFVLDRGDHLHYVLHLTLGRLLDLVPATRPLAQDQYLRARAHARTWRQWSLVTSAQPTTAVGRVEDAVGMVSSGLRWGARGVGRLARHVPVSL